MKAKEYLQRYKAVDTSDKDKLVDVIASILMDLYDEVFKLKESRKVSTDAGVVGIFREIKQKWNAIHPNIPGTHETMFEMVVLHNSPKLYDCLKKNGVLKEIK
jgi:hypothetical protein